MSQNLAFGDKGRLKGGTAGSAVTKGALDVYLRKLYSSYSCHSRGSAYD